MQIHNLIQGSDEWLQFRLTRFGASEAAAMLGLSKKVKRSELLHMKHTGNAKEFSDWVQANILDYGHEVEALARPIVEEIIGADLYPVTCSDGMLSASCDGLTMDETIAFEHKQHNAKLAESVAAGILPEEYMPQCQQILMITGAEKVVFVCSDGTRENMQYMDVLPDQTWFDRIRAGWNQFAEDLANYTPPAVTVEAVGRTPETLPALRIEVTGLVTASNLDQFKKHALAVFGGINRDLKTDQDFADADKAVKWCGDVEDRLKAAKQHALSQTESIDALFRTIDEISAEARATRLELDKLVKARKEQVRDEILQEGINALRAHVAALNTRLGKPYMPTIPADFAGAMRGKKTVASLRDAVSTTLANAKIEANAIADRIQTNREMLRPQNGVAGDDWISLFPDFASVCTKSAEDFHNLVTTRVAAEQQRREAERERIRKEEADRLERAQKEEDALIASIWSNARRIEFDSVPYIQKAIRYFESGAKDFEGDPRPRVVTAIAEARAEMNAKLVAAQQKQDVEVKLQAEQELSAAKQSTEGAELSPAAQVLNEQEGAVRFAAAHPTAAKLAPAPAWPFPEDRAPATPSRAPTLRLGQINERLGFAATADFLTSIGFPPAATDKSAKLYHDADFPRICSAIAQHAMAVGRQFAQLAA